MLTILAVTLLWLIQLVQYRRTFNIWRKVFPDTKLNESWFYLLYIGFGSILITLFSLGYMTASFLFVGMILANVILAFALTFYLMSKLDWHDEEKLEKDIQRLRNYQMTGGI